MRRLGGIDTMFVRAETSSMYLHVAGVLVLDVSTIRASDPRQAVRALVAERLPLLPPFRWRLIEPPGGMGALRWIEDPTFDLDRHVHLGSLPAPGTRTELERFTAHLASTPLDRARPLWQMHILDGLDDGTVAVVSTLHHAFMDGGAGAEVMASLFDLTEEAESTAPTDTWQPEEPPPTWQLLADTPGEVIDRLGQIPSTLASTATGLGGFIGAMFPGGANGRRASVAPRSAYNGRLTPDRVVTLSDCSLTEVKAIKTAFGTTVNDVVLAVVTSSLRADLAARGRLVEMGEQPLVAAVPISVRTPDREGDFGNHTSVMMVPLPTHIDDPHERLTAIHDFTVHTKGQHQAMGSDLLERWAGLVPPWVISTGTETLNRTGLIGLVPPMSNLTVSNVQGPPIPLYLAGAKVVATYPLGPLVEGSGLNITVFSQCDQIHIGIVTDPTLVPDARAIATGVSRGITELLDLTTAPTGSVSERA